MSDDDVVQLDLTLSVTVVPQANNLALFVRLMDELHRGVHEIEALADALEVEERTTHYYVDFGRWLKMLATPEPGRTQFTDLGYSFAESVPARGRIFAQAMFARKLIKTVQALKRDSTNEDDLETLDTRSACLKAIRGLTDLSESTAARRASGVAHMLEAAYKPSRIDWTTGEPNPEYRRKLEYDGRSFATALGARQFGVAREFRIGFPRQVRVFVEHEGHGINARRWNRASWNTSGGDAVWFGGVPVNASTVEVAARGGRDLRRFLVQVAPYISLSVAMLTYRDRLGRPSTRFTHDMYGLKVWEHDRELGSPLQVLDQLATQLELVPTKGVPKELLDAEPELVEPGVDTDLLATLSAAGFITEQDTTYTVSPGIEAELRDARDDAASLAELLGPAWEALGQLLRDLS